MCRVNEKSQPNAGHPHVGWEQIRGVHFAVTETCMQFWCPGGCSRVREAQTYEQTQRARMILFVEEKAQER